MSLLDTLGSTTANLAVSLGRRLRAAYAGPAFQVKRSSDSTTLDIGYLTGTDNVDIPALLTFCAGTNGFLTRVYDNMSSGYLVPVGTALPQVVAAGALLHPINGYPSANAGMMTMAGIVLPASSQVNVVAATVNPGSPANSRLMSFIANGQANDYGNSASFLIDAQNSTGSLNAYRNSTFATVAGPLNAPLAVGAAFEGANATLNLNGVTATVTPASVYGGTGTINLHNDGWNGAGTGEPWSGWTSELMVAGVMSGPDYAAALANVTQFYAAGAPPAGQVIFRGFPPGPASLHRYWRLRLIDCADHSNYIYLCDVQFRTAAGVLQLFSGGTASATTTNAGTPASAADNNTATYWGGGYYFATNNFWAYDYGLGNQTAIVEVQITTGAANFARAPTHFWLEWSDDGLNWTPKAGWWVTTPWTASTSQVFTVATMPADSPSANTTLDPATLGASTTLSGGNLTATLGAGATAGTNGARSTTAHSQGQYYFETTINSTSNPSYAGLMPVGASYPDAFASNHGIVVQVAGNILLDGVVMQSFVGWPTQVGGHKVDFDRGIYSFRRTPADPFHDQPMGPALNGVAMTIVVGWQAAGGDSTKINTGGSAFAGVVPAGFVAWDPPPPASAPLTGAITVTGFAPSAGISGSPPAAAITITGFAPTTSMDQPVAAGGLFITGLVPVAGVAEAPPAGRLIFTGFAPSSAALSLGGPMISIIV